MQDGYRVIVVFLTVCRYQLKTEIIQEDREMAQCAEPGAVNGAKPRKVAIITGITGQVRVFVSRDEIGKERRL